MPRTQLPPVPREGAKPRWRDGGWLIAYGARGFWGLIRARWAFDRMQARDIVERNKRVAATASPAPATADPALVARIGYVIPRISARLPWRSDCVIQAIAAQDWLAEHGLASEIRIGVERPADDKFGAHAWLVHDGVIVTGGDIDRYDVLLGPVPGGRDSA